MGHVTHIWKLSLGEPHSPGPRAGCSSRLDRGCADFYEKAHFVKPTWRLPRGRVQRLLYPSRYASIRTLSVSHSLYGSPVHYEIHLFRLISGAAIFRAVSPFGWAK